MSDMIGYASEREREKRGERERSDMREYVSERERERQIVRKGVAASCWNNAPKKKSLPNLMAAKRGERER